MHLLRATLPKSIRQLATETTLTILLSGSDKKKSRLAPGFFCACSNANRPEELGIYPHLAISES